MTIGSAPTAGPGETLEFDFAGDVRPEEQLVVDLDGFEGPLDLLLALARTHKLDLGRISILALAEQYLVFIDEASKLRLEVAADYLVMAAWLAYLKSRLLLPKEEAPSEEISGEALAAMLSHRLRRLEAMREQAARLMARPQLGQSLFARGMPEGVRVTRDSRYTASVFDLLSAYVDQRKRTVHAHYTVKARTVWSIKEARTRLEKLLGVGLDWTALDDYLIQFAVPPAQRRSALASSLGASLELTREGEIELDQREPFGTIFVRRRFGVGAGDNDA